MSKHLRLLESNGLVVYRVEGTRNVYALEPAAIAALRDELNRMWQLAFARYAPVAGKRNARGGARGGKR